MTEIWDTLRICKLEMMKLEKKKFLRQAFNIYRRLIGRAERIERLQELTKHVTTIINGVPSGRQNDKSLMEVSAVEVDEQIMKMAEDTVYFFKVFEEISAVISVIDDDDERTVLEYRYLSFQSWKEIAAAMGLSLQHVYRLHSRALDKINIPAAQISAI